MNVRQRFVKTMHFRSVDRPPCWPIMYVWGETLRRWAKEGLPPEIAHGPIVEMEKAFNPFFRLLKSEEDTVKSAIGLEEYFGLDQKAEYAPVNFRFCPPFPIELIEEEKNTVVYIDDEGVLVKQRKDNPELSMPQFLEFPVKTRKDFEQKIRHKMDPDSPDRFPKKWDEECQRWKKRNVPLFLLPDRVGGFFGPLRGMMGLEKLLLTFYDDPAFIEEMMDAKLELMMGVIRKVLSDTTIDAFIFWEDMAYNKGPLLSPSLFKKFMVPRYRKITDFLRSKGVDTIMVDSDGNIDELIPLWLEGGVNGFYPLEVQSGMDVLKLRKKYGKDIFMMGGLDKKVLAKDKEAIKEEVMSKIPPLIEKGGYIPMTDHGIPPDVSFSNICYFVKLIKQIFGKR